MKIRRGVQLKVKDRDDQRLSLGSLDSPDEGVVLSLAYEKLNGDSMKFDVWLDKVETLRLYNVLKFALEVSK